MSEEESELSREELLQRYGSQSTRAPGSARRSPFKFLDSYDLEDADIFFGRDNEIEELLAHFRSYGHVLIYGESGSGKSSLVQCGLRSQIPEADALFIPLRVHTTGLPTVCHQICESASQQLGDAVESSPEAGLVETLRAALEAASRPIVLFFDQFEELFIFHDSEVRRDFAGDLASIRTARLQVKILIGVRQDYLGHLSELEDTVEGLFDNRFWLRRMSRENAAEAVVKACGTCEVSIEDELAQAILHRLDPGGKGVELPYLQVVMDRLYRQAVEANPTEPVISAGEVEQLGDITDILGTFLVEEVAKLPAPDTGRQILKAFVTGEGTRRTLDREAVAQEAAGFGAAIPQDVLEAHLNQLASVRILREIADTDSYELRHDALAATVAGWISEVEKELIEVRDNLVNRFKEYEARDQDTAALLDQGFLDYLGVYRERLKPLLNDTLRQYVADSERHVGQAARVRRRVRLVVAGVVSSIVLVFLAVALWQWREATRREQEAHVQEGLAWLERAEGFLNRKPPKQPDRFGAALMAARAIGFAGYGREKTDREFQDKHLNFLGDSAEGDRARAILEQSVVLPIWQGPVFRHQDGPIDITAFSPDGETIVSGSSNGIFKLWNSNPETGDLIRAIEASPTPASSMAVSSDRRLLGMGDEKGNLRIWKAETGKLIRWIRAGAAHEAVCSLSFSPDGETIASGSANGNVKIWEVSTGSEIGFLQEIRDPDEPDEPDDPVESLCFGPDGNKLAAGSRGGRLTLWDLVKREPIDSPPAAHDGPVYSLAFNQSGEHLASGGADGTVRLWNGETGAAIRSFEETASDIQCVKFAPGGGVLASGSSDGAIRLWNVEKGNVSVTISGRQAAVRSLSFNSDGKRLVSGGETGLIQLWEIVSDKEVREIRPSPGAQGSVVSVAISPDGKTGASGAKNGTLKLWDIASGKELAALDAHQDSVSNLAFSPDGETLASVGDDGAVNFWNWNVPGGTEISSTLRYTGRFSSVTFSVGGKLLAAEIADEGTVEVREVESGNLLQSIASDGGPIFEAALSPDGRRLLAGAGVDGAIRIWDVASGEAEEIIPDPGGVLSSVAFSPDGRLLALARADGTIVLWDRNYAELLKDITGEDKIGSLSGHKERVNDLAFSPDGQTLISGSEDGTVKFWRVHTGHEIRSFDGHDETIQCAAAPGPEGVIASGDYGGVLKLWNPETGRAIGSRSDKTPVNSVAFSPVGKRLAFASDDKTIQFWDWEDTDESVNKSLRECPMPALCVAFSADGKILASGHEKDEAGNGIIRLWNAETGIEIGSTPGHVGSVKAIAFRPVAAGKQILASGGNDRLVRLWELKTAENGAINLQPLKDPTEAELSHGAEVWSVIFSPDGQLVASGSKDRSIKMWDVGTLTETRSFFGHQSPVKSLAFGPGGKLLASGSQGGVLRLWNVETGGSLPSHNGHGFMIVGLGFSPDGKTLFSAGLETIKIWDSGFLTSGVRPNLAAYLSENWLELDGPEVRWKTTADNLFSPRRAEKFLNVSRFSQLGLLREDSANAPAK